MSVVKRPHGDSLARKFGDYFQIKEIASIKAGDKMDLLCKDGVNYVVTIKSIDHKSNFCHIHFHQWSKSYDYRGTLNNLYFAVAGTYSEPLVKTYEIKNEAPKSKVKIDAMTRYPEDFFAKPVFNWQCSRRGRDSGKDNCKHIQT
jgi:hypothetical protein